MEVEIGADVEAAAETDVETSAEGDSGELGVRLESRVKRNSCQPGGKLDHFGLATYSCCYGSHGREENAFCLDK